MREEVEPPRADQGPEEVERRETALANFFVPYAWLSLSCRRSTPSQTSWQNCWSRANVTCSLHAAELQIERGGRVLFEHPVAALDEPLAVDGVRCVRCDQCQFGMASVVRVGNVGLACKATGFMTNDECAAEAVNRRCFGGHESHPVVERQSEILRTVSPTVGGSDTACFATQHASRGMRPSTENGGTRSTADNRSSGGWADSGGAGVAVAR